MFKNELIIMTILMNFLISAMSAEEKPVWGVESGVDKVGIRYIDGKDVPGDGPKVRGIFYDGPKGSEVFGFIASPEGEKPNGGWPGIVLVHGGGGAAFPEWVRMWALRGYVAIAMNHLSRTNGGWASFCDKSRQGLPRFEGDNFFTKAAVEQEPEKWWAWNAAQAVSRAGILLRTHPDVNPERVAITGISWGGYLTTIVTGIDHHFAVAVPVYGAGYLEKSSCWAERLKANDPAVLQKWVRSWDPARFAPFGRTPVLFLNGRNDRFYYVDSHSETAFAYGGTKRSVSYLPIGHGHGGPGESPLEIFAAVRQYCENGPLVPRIASDERKENKLIAKFEDTDLIEGAFLLWTDTDDKNPPNARKWQETTASFDRGTGVVVGNVPDKAVLAILNCRTKVYDVPGRMWGMEKGKVVPVQPHAMIFSGRVHRMNMP